MLNPDTLSIIIFRFVWNMNVQVAWLKEKKIRDKWNITKKQI